MSKRNCEGIQNKTFSAQSQIINIIICYVSGIQIYVDTRGVMLYNSRRNFGII